VPTAGENRAVTPSTRSSPTAGGRLLVGIAIVALAFNLRLAVSSVGVLLETVRAELGMSPTVAGILTTLPVVCFAVAGLGAGRFVRGLGLHRTTALALVCIAAGITARAITSSSVVFLLASTVTLVGMAVGNVVLPPLTRTHFPDRVPLVSAVYGSALMTGAAVASISTVPITDAFDSWRLGLGFWAALAIAALLPWLTLLRHDRHVGPPQAHTLGVASLLRSRFAWTFAVCFGAQAAQAYAQMGWYPAILVDAGISETRAGFMLGLLAAIGIPLTLTLPWLIARAGERAILPWAFATITIGGWTGALITPATATWLWTALLGLGGGSFTWCLTMIGRRARTTDGTTALSGFVQGVGYLIASIGPLGTGVVHDLTGSWTAPLLGLIALSALIGVCGAVVVRPTAVEDTL